MMRMDPANDADTRIRYPHYPCIRNICSAIRVISINMKRKTVKILWTILTAFVALSMVLWTVAAAFTF